MNRSLALQANSANELFCGAVEAVTTHGSPVSPRGIPTIEILGAVLQLNRPRARFIHISPARVLNPAFAVAEVIWILSGTDDPWIFEYNGQLRQFADDGVLRGAYGVRMRHWGPNGLDQLALVTELLAKDPDTRRAVIQIYDPWKDAAGSRDVPCTLSYRFHLRNGQLHMSTTMRSQDVWLGLPYDLFTATVIHELVAGWVGAELGTYTLYVDSLHLYASDLASAAKVPSSAPILSPNSLDWPDLSLPFQDLNEVLVAVLSGQQVGHAGWDMMGGTMLSYRNWKNQDRLVARKIASELGDPSGVYLTSWYDKLEGGQVHEGGHQ